jgi:23S rRNA (cytosine1962-C5)-methyltransferase
MAEETDSSESAGATASLRGGVRLPRVFVKRRRAQPFLSRHPWVFAGAIDRLEGQPADGDEVGVCTYDGEFIARGLYNTQSQIRVRLYAWDDRPLDESFWRERLDAAVELRSHVLQLDQPSSACRLVFSEADGLSGIVVDRYGDWLALQITSLAMARRRDTLVRLLVERCRPRGIVLRTERGIAEAEGLEIADGSIWGDSPDGTITVVENGLEFEVDIRTGQKTGFYLDQRDNRVRAASFARGRRVLDVFCYTGGFALAAARAGAAEVIGVDVSRTAVELAQRNAMRNGFGSIRFETADAFEFMQGLTEKGELASRFGMIILDPPKFARHTRAIDQALRGYLRANLLAIKLLEPNGILVTCSCSGHVSRDDFAAVLAAAAAQSRRPIQMLAQLGQAPDHPVAVSCPETDYLKCIVARVE